MTLEQKEHILESFTNWLHDITLDHLLQTDEPFEDLDSLLYRFINEVDVEWEEEWESYETMQPKFEQVQYFLKNLFCARW